MRDTRRQQSRLCLRRASIGFVQAINSFVCRIHRGALYTLFAKVLPNSVNLCHSRHLSVIPAPAYARAGMTGLVYFASGRGVIIVSNLEPLSSTIERTGKKPIAGASQNMRGPRSLL